jgi:predicted transcriptional regulator
MGNSKQKIIEKLNCIPDGLSEEEIIERLYRMTRLEHSKQRCEKEGIFTDEQVMAHFADESSALDRGIEDMEAGRELPLQKAMEKVSELRNERRNSNR